MPEDWIPTALTDLAATSAAAGTYTTSGGSLTATLRKLVMAQDARKGPYRTWPTVLASGVAVGGGMKTPRQVDDGSGRLRLMAAWTITLPATYDLAHGDRIDLADPATGRTHHLLVLARDPVNGDVHCEEEFA